MKVEIANISIPYYKRLKKTTYLGTLLVLPEGSKEVKPVDVYLGFTKKNSYVAIKHGDEECPCTVYRFLSVDIANDIMSETMPELVAALRFYQAKLIVSKAKRQHKACLL